jgi:hypothetical protein
VGQTLQATLTRNYLGGNNSPISSITSLGKRKPVKKTNPKKSSPDSKDDLFASMGLSTKPIFLPTNAKASPAGRPVASWRAAQPNLVSLLPMPRHPPQHEGQQVNGQHNLQEQQPYIHVAPATANFTFAIISASFDDDEACGNDDWDDGRDLDGLLND